MTFSRRSFLESGIVFNAAFMATPAQFGAQADGVADDGAALTAAFASAQVVRLEAGKVYRLGDFTIPAGALLVFDAGARIRPLRAGATLTINGRIESIGSGRIFEDGWSFAKADILDGYEDVPLEWFGGRASWSAKQDSLRAFRYALTFCKAMRSRTILLGNGCYFVSGTINIDGAVGIQGRGIQSTFLFRNGGPAAAATIQLDGVSNHATSDVRFSSLSIMSLDAGKGIGIRSIWFAHVDVRDVEFRNCATGLDLADGSYSWRIADCRFLENATHVRLGENANNTILSGCQLLHGETGVSFVGSSNSISICGETNFEAIRGRPVAWSGRGTRVVKLSIVDSRFEKCVGAIGRESGDARVSNLAFERNYVENNAGTSSEFFYLPECDTVFIARCYFERTLKGLVNAPPTVSQLTICDNVLVNISQINSASREGGITAAEGFQRCRAYNCGGVRGSVEA